MMPHTQTIVIGAKIVNRYASKEVYDIARQCPSGNHLHVSSEAMLLETVKLTRQAMRDR